MAAEDKGADAMALDEKATPPEGGAPAVRFEIRKWNAVCMYVCLPTGAGHTGGAARACTQNAADVADI